jgi:hypothetical protein
VDESAELAAEVGRVAHSAVPVSDDGLGDKGGEVVVVLPADTLNSNGDVGSGHGVVTDPDLRSNEVGLALKTAGGGVGLAVGVGVGKLGEVLFGQVDELLVGNATGANEDHAVGSVVSLDVVLEVAALDAANVLLGSENGAAQRLALESGSVQMVEHNLLQLLVNLLLFAQNYIALALDR